MNRLLSALGSINCAELDYMTWIQVGMALKAEGMDVSVWDEWSRTDPKRYHPGECHRRWDSFNGSASPVTGATIYKLARDNGWSPFTGEAGIMDWNDVITYDGSGSDPGDEAEQSPTDDLILYLQTLFAPEDYVGYVTNDAWQNDDGKWVPAKGVYTRTAGELIDFKYGLGVLVSAENNPQMKCYGLGALALAEEVKDFPSRVDVDDHRFFAPASMIEAIRQFCAETSQPIPETPGFSKDFH